MDIRNWGLDQIMMLPDHCFGRRWPIFLKTVGAAASPRFAISPQGLPDMCVIWWISVVAAKATIIVGEFELRIGDEVPANWAAFQLQDLLYPRPGIYPGLTESIGTATNVYPFWGKLRYPVHAQGRRIILGVNAGFFVGNDVQACVVVSSIPTEVPDCLLSV